VVDHQVGLFHLVRDFAPEQYRNNLLAHAAIGKLFNLPTVLTSSSEFGIFFRHCSCSCISNTPFKGPNGPIPKEILDMHQDAPLIRRRGEVNAWDNEEFRAAVMSTTEQDNTQQLKLYLVRVLLLVVHVRRPSTRHSTR
jgi:hypothetical protein